ncbi:MAG: FtsX-like permease family protein, partial [Erysipelotrichales bacterium]
MVNNVLAPIGVMSDIFPMLFFVVAAVIILISMSKNVENDRTQIAIMMALGYPRSRIMFVYLFYGWWAALIGALGFSLIGNQVIPTVLISIFTTRFSLPPIALKIFPEYALIAVVLAIFFASAAILMALRHVLREIPAAAMRPKAPKNARNSFLERFPKVWNRFSYATKLIVRNLLMGRTKLLLSSIGVIGALTLLIMGLSLQNSATLMIDNSISSYHFQYSLHLNEELASIEGILLTIPTSDIERVKTIGTKLLNTQDTIALNLLETGENLLTMKTSSGKEITINDDSVVIPKSMALIYGLKIGDRLSLTLDQQQIDLTITDINNQYLGKNVYISFNHAGRLNLDTLSDRIYVANQSGITSKVDIARLLGDPRIRAVDTKENMVDRSKEIMSMLNRIIAIIVLSAAILAMTVLYNLATINIFERQRELATLRVLGYTRREVQRLINVENRVLSVLGTLGGIPLGILLFGWIADMVSTPDFMMSKEVNLMIILMAVLLLLIFTEITNLILRRKIRTIKFVESLKGVE